ncbi:MAG: sugar transferase [Gammaproteobacteria bacterium]
MSIETKLKRSIDVLGAIVALLLVSVPMLIIAIAIRTAMGGPVMFRQLRPGLRGVPFEILKFRTMKRIGNTLGISDEARLTRLGRFLRSLSLDELPELWNVLKGDMSLVGPRPLLMDYIPLYTGAQARRHEVRPGLTGLAQVRGRNALSWEERFRLDVWYVDNWSLGLDVKILALTLVKVLQREGISQPGQATVEYFSGTPRKPTGNHVKHS